MSEEGARKVGPAAEKPAGNRGKGRKKGVPNKTTATLKEAILLAAEEHGEDDQGKDGLKGYLRKVAREDVKAFSSLLGRVLPLALTDGDGKAIPLTVQIVPETESAE